MPALCSLEIQEGDIDIIGRSTSIRVVEVPEPGSPGLLVGGLVTPGLIRRRKLAA